MPKQKHTVGLQIVAPSCACRAAAFLDFMDPSRSRFTQSCQLQARGKAGAGWSADHPEF